MTEATNTAPAGAIGGEDLVKALCDAYGQGRAYGRQQKYPETQEITNEPRDAWIRQYMARMPATNPITTASNPRVGGQEAWADLSPQEIVQRTRCQADCDFAPYSAAVWRECCDLILSRLGSVSVALEPTPPDQGDEEVAEHIVQRLLDAKYDLRDVAGRFEAINIVREEVGRQTFAPWVRSLDDARFTENEVAPIKERLERAFYDAGGFHGQLVEYAARTALPVVLDLIASAPSPEAGAGGDLGELERLSANLSHLRGAAVAVLNAWNHPHDLDAAGDALEAAVRATPVGKLVGEVQS